MLPRRIRIRHQVDCLQLLLPALLARVPKGYRDGRRKPFAERCQQSTGGRLPARKHRPDIQWGSASVDSLVSAGSNILSSFLGPKVLYQCVFIDKRHQRDFGMQAPRPATQQSGQDARTRWIRGSARPWVLSCPPSGQPRAPSGLSPSCSSDTAKKAADTATEKVADDAKAVTDAAAPKTADAVKTAAAAIHSIELPGGLKLDGAQGVSRSGWTAAKSFAFDAVTFESDSATLAPTSTAQIEQLATVLKAFPDVIVSVEDHTDNTGDPTANKKLSEDRAAAVKAALAATGMPGGRVMQPEIRGDFGAFRRSHQPRTQRAQGPRVSRVP
ncbi:MAG TPA: OmpA family protein [Chthoniobacterales bacterium]